MAVDLIKKGERPTADCTAEQEKSEPQHERDRMNDLEITPDKNLRAKKALAEELVSMGLSREAIERVLHVRLKATGIRRMA